MAWLQYVTYINRKNILKWHQMSDLILYFLGKCQVGVIPVLQILQFIYLWYKVKITRETPLVQPYQETVECACVNGSISPICIYDMYEFNACMSLYICVWVVDIYVYKILKTICNISQCIFNVLSTDLSLGMSDVIWFNKSSKTVLANTKTVFIVGSAVILND